MSLDYTIVLKANDVDDVGTAESITIEVYGCQPLIVDEGDARTFSGGYYSRKKRFRLRFNCPLQEFAVDPETGARDARQYMRIMRLLGKDHLWLAGFGADLLRLDDPVLGFVALGIITLPIKVDVSEIPDISANFDEFTDEATLAFLSCDRFTIPDFD
jgi:hypothetical protein